MARVAGIAALISAIVAVVALLYTAGVFESEKARAEREQQVRDACANSDMVEETPWHSRDKALEACVKAKM